MKRRFILLAALAGGIASAAPPPPRAPILAIAGMRFGPAPAGLKAGDTILFVNRDIVAHSATARDHSFDVTLEPRQAVRVTLRRAGVVDFYCRFHPAMTGTLSVAAR